MVRRGRKYRLTNAAYSRKQQVDSIPGQKVLVDNRYDQEQRTAKAKAEKHTGKHSSHFAADQNQHLQLRPH
ncbi:MAG: hypothetical protein CMK60_03235 [Proteobacteria bacterium]|nr:hypothetical protein [Pseudomonadota bacterium]